MNATARLVVPVAPLAFAGGRARCNDTFTSVGPRAFVGRERELQRLLTALASAERGLGSLLLVTGGAGIGKTRLADELGDAAASRGFGVRWGRSWESGGAPAYWPWTQIFSASASAPEGPSALAPIGDQPVHPDEVSAARFATFRAALAHLAALSRQQPLLVVLEDLHAADQPSLLLLRFLASELRGLRLVIVGIYRENELATAPEIAEELARLARDADGLLLGPLAPADVTTLVRHRLPELAETTVASIVRATLGNPFYVDQVLRGLEAEGDRIRAAGVEQLCVPAGLNQVLRQQLGRLAPPARAALQTASVLGSEFRCQSLATLLDLPILELEALLESAVDAGVLSTGRRHRYVFASDLYREVLYRSLTPQQRSALHTEAARLITARHTSEGEPQLGPRGWAELAHHLLEAGPVAVEPAVTAAIRAAEQALHALAHEDARAILQRAQNAFEGAAGASAIRTRLHLAQAVAEYRGGDLDRARALYLQALASARSLGEGELLAVVAFAEGVELTDLTDLSRGLDPAAILREALAALPECDSPLRARVMARLAAAQPPATGVEGSIELGRAAIAMARRVAHPPTLLAVLHESMAAMMDFIHPDERLALDSELERLCTEFGDWPRSLRANARLVFDHLGRGDLARADACIATYERLGTQLAPGQDQWRVPLFRAMRALMEGRFAEAEAGAATAEATALRLGDHTAGACLAAHRLATLRTRESFADFPRLMVELRTHWGGFPGAEAWFRVITAVVHLRKGELAEARQVTQPIALADLLPSADAGLLGQLAEVTAAIGDQALAVALYQRLQSYSGWLMNCGLLGMYCEGPYDRQLGLLAVALGQRAAAERHFETAVARTRALGLWPHLSRVLFEYARGLRGFGDARDEPRIQALLAESSGIAAQLAQAGLLAQIEALAGAPVRDSSPRVPTGAPADAAPPAGLRLAREGECWTVGFADEVLRLRHSCGLETLFQLISHPEREFHATELLVSDDSVIDAGDAGELLDDEARCAYRRRHAELREQLAEAESFGDAARAARIEAEIEFLAAELSRAVGLGGRVRRAGQASERARVAVQKRIKGAIRRISDGAPALGRHLTATVRTGTFCAYRPALAEQEPLAAAPARW